ncbi:MAG TPA: hypothetical protein VK183_04495 [Flavobacterium sp.]|nr:hypothetical protein [Flavobacterium sp.]
MKMNHVVVFGNKGQRYVKRGKRQDVVKGVRSKERVSRSRKREVRGERKEERRKRKEKRGKKNEIEKHEQVNVA